LTPLARTALISSALALARPAFVDPRVVRAGVAVCFVPERFFPDFVDGI
jgi:hypothetical protein